MRVDEVAIREFLHTSYPRLVAAVALTSGSRPAAEDAVQEALIRAWERSDKGEEIASLEGWVTTVALNLARSGLRRIRSERRARARLHTPALGEPPTADRIDVDRALAALPRRVDGKPCRVHSFRSGGARGGRPPRRQQCWRGRCCGRWPFPCW